MDILILTGNDDGDWTRDLLAISAPVAAELGCKVTIATNANPIARAYAAVIVTPPTEGDVARLREAINATEAFTVEVLPANPSAGGAQIPPFGTDALLYGLGLDGYAAAIRMIHAHLGGRA